MTLRSNNKRTIEEKFSSQVTYGHRRGEDVGLDSTEGKDPTSANYFVLCKAVDCCTVFIAPQQGPGWTASPNGNLAMQLCVQLWKTLLQAQAKYYGVLWMTVQHLSIWLVLESTLPDRQSLVFLAVTLLCIENRHGHNKTRYHSDTNKSITKSKYSQWHSEQINRGRCEDGYAFQWKRQHLAMCS